MKQLTVKYVITSAEHYGIGQSLFTEQTITTMGQSATIFDSEDDTQQSDIFSTADQEVPNFPVSTDNPSPEVDPVPSSRCSVCVPVGRPKKG